MEAGYLNQLQNNEVVDSFNKVFFGKIHKNLHLSKDRVKTGIRHKDNLIQYISNNIMQSNLVRDFVYDTLQNIGGTLSRTGLLSRNEEFVGLSSRKTETKIVIFKLLALLKFNFIPYLKCVYEVENKDGSIHIEERTSINDEIMRKMAEYENMFLFENLNEQCLNLAQKYINKQKKSDEPSRDLKLYNTKLENLEENNHSQKKKSRKKYRVN